MDIERSLIELPLCGTPYPMTLGLLYHAHRDGNQSGAEKDNRLLF